jgi:beta-RFAP synthase
MTPAPLEIPPGTSHPGRVRVTAPARLHLGFLDLHGGLGRRFGGIGLAIDAPATVLAVEPAEGLEVAPGPEAGRIARAAEAAARALGVAPHARFTLQAHIPPHAGLGSGTQLALAVAAGLARLHDGEPAARALARATQRGQRSGIGIAAFDEGGFLLDGGRGGDDAPPPQLLRLAFPEDWRVLLVFDRAARGLAGQDEITAFGELPPMQAACSATLCRHVLMRVLPGLVERRFETYTDGIETVQRLLGEHFAAVQRGRYTSERVAAALERARALGARGLGQSSWGPTGFAFLPGDATAELVRTRLVSDFRGEPGLDFAVVRGRNEGARIETLATEAGGALRAALQDA